MAKTAPKKKKPQQPSSTKAKVQKPAAVEPEASPPFVRLVHPLVVAFVVYHIVCITIYALPTPSQAILDDKVQPRGSDAFLKFNQQVWKQSAPIYGYLYPLGFWQYWDMFAPDPAQTDLWMSAEIEYLDGTTKEAKYPRIYDMPIMQKFIYERHRKFYERVNDNRYGFLWPPVSQYLALQNATDPANPPVKVTLIRHFQEAMRHDHPTAQEPPYTAIRFYWYAVDQKKLFTDKGWKFGLH